MIWTPSCGSLTLCQLLGKSAANCLDHWIDRVCVVSWHHVNFHLDPVQSVSNKIFVKLDEEQNTHILERVGVWIACSQTSGWKIDIQTNVWHLYVFFPLTWQGDLMMVKKLSDMLHNNVIGLSICSYHYFYDNTYHSLSLYKPIDSHTIFQRTCLNISLC